MIIHCEICGKATKAKPSRHQKYCSKKCKGMAMSGSHSPQWKGGQYISGGYVYLMAKDHPRANRYGYVKRATLALEQKIGRYLLPGEVAHHVNELKQDDRPENLIALFNIPHVTLHNQNISEETRKKRRIKSLGRTQTEETKRKIGLANKGKRRSLEICQKMSKSRKGLFAGNKNPNWKHGKYTKTNV